MSGSADFRTSNIRKLAWPREASLMAPMENNRGNRRQGIKEIVLINDLHQQGLSISAIARKVGCDLKTVKKYIERGLEAPRYGPRAARVSVLEPYTAYLTERVATFPDLSGRRLLWEIRKLGYKGSYSTLKPFLREIRPPKRVKFERRLETPYAQPAQVDSAEFSEELKDEPVVTRQVCLSVSNTNLLLPPILRRAH